jgi:hypothetical protein
MKRRKKSVLLGFHFIIEELWGFKHMELLGLHDYQIWLTRKTVIFGTKILSENAVFNCCDMKEIDKSQTTPVSMSDNKVNTRAVVCLMFHDLPGESSFNSRICPEKWLLSLLR